MVKATQLRNSCLHGSQQIARVQAVNQVGYDFGIGLAGEDVALRLQGGAQRLMVLDDAVVRPHAATRPTASGWPLASTLGP